MDPLCDFLFSATYILDYPGLLNLRCGNHRYGEPIICYTFISFHYKADVGIPNSKSSGQLYLFFNHGFTMLLHQSWCLLVFPFVLSVLVLDLLICQAVLFVWKLISSGLKLTAVFSHVLFHLIIPFTPSDFYSDWHLNPQPKAASIVYFISSPNRWVLRFNHVDSMFYH